MPSLTPLRSNLHTLHTLRTRVARAARCSAAVVAVLAASLTGMQAAASTDTVAGLGQPVRGMDSRPCQSTPKTESALHRIGHEWQAQGMALNALCNAVSGAWVVQVRVVDGMKASKVVRGPLADGHDVDMGTPAGVALAGAQPGAKGFSPDVQYNRQWLYALMARHDFHNLPDAWWHFARRGAIPPAGEPTDIASR